MKMMPDKMIEKLKVVCYVSSFVHMNNKTLLTICWLYLRVCLYATRKMSQSKAAKILLAQHLKLEVIPLKIFNNLLKKYNNLNCDREKCILVSNKILHKLTNRKQNEDDGDKIKTIPACIKSEDWVTIMVENECGTRFKRSVQVLTVDGLNETVLICDLHMFNIIQQTPMLRTQQDSSEDFSYDGPKTEVSPRQSNNKKYNNCLKYMTGNYHIVSLVHLDNYSPQVYSCVHLEYVASFHNRLNDEIFKNLMDNYFMYPRYHHLNDIIKIDLKKYNLDLFKTDEVNYVCNVKYVYVKVCGMENLVDDCYGIQPNENAIQEDKSGEIVNKGGNPNSDENINSSISTDVKSLKRKFLKIISKILEQNHHGCYITSSHTAIKIKNTVQSFIPNVVKQSALHVQDVQVSNYEKYVLPSYNDCPYFQKLLKCVKVFHFGERKHLLNFEMNQILLVTGSQNSGLEDLMAGVAEMSGVHIKQVDCISLIGSVPTIVEKNLDNCFEKAIRCAPSILVFHNIEDLCLDQAGNEDARAMQCFIHHLSRLTTSLSRTIVVCTSAKPDKIHHQIKRLFLKTIDVLPLTETERRHLIEYQLRYAAAECRFDPSLVDYLTAITSGFERHDLLCLVRLSVKNKLLSQSLKDLQAEDFQQIHAELQARYSDRLDAPSVPNVSWEDIGGLSKLKGEILSTFRAVKKSSGLKRSGLLLHGPPGTGKTLIAKAVATECRMNFLAVKGPELLNKYIGQSEENIRNVFLKARSAAPCVVFFDELDSLAPRRGQEDQSSGVMDRVVSQLLAEMDGVHSSKDVFILGATNRVDLLDPAILRPGRLDKSLCVGLYEDRNSQLGVLKAVVRKFQLSDDVHLDSLVKQFPLEMSGADIYSICSQAWTRAIRRMITISPELKHATVKVNMEDFVGACPAVATPDIVSSPVTDSDVAPEVIMS